MQKTLGAPQVFDEQSGTGQQGQQGEIVASSCDGSVFARTKERGDAGEYIAARGQPAKKEIQDNLPAPEWLFQHWIIIIARFLQFPGRIRGVASDQCSQTFSDPLGRKTLHGLENR
jgi:hypothetical protein